MNRLSYALLVASALAGCDNRTTYLGLSDGGADDLAAKADLSTTGNGNPDLAVGGCTELTGCYTVYAHSDHVLYKLDLANKSLALVGPFNAPMVSVSGKMVEDSITDLAVAPDNTIWVISKESLYTASATDGHVTKVGPVTTCGTDNVALTFTPDGKLYAADKAGAFCQIDITVKPPVVRQITPAIGNGLAVSGDLVAVSDGTMYATAYLLSDAVATGKNNYLVTIDPATGKASAPIGQTGFPKLFGIAFDNGLVYGFSYDGTGTVITIDPKTGKGTKYGTFTDPSTSMPIGFWGAGVNAMVQAPPPG